MKGTEGHKGQLKCQQHGANKGIGNGLKMANIHPGYYALANDWHWISGSPEKSVI